MGRRRRAAVDAANINGATPLCIASEHDHLEMVRELLARGAAVDAASNDGAAPLPVATVESHLEVVREQLARGAAVNTAHPSPRDHALSANARKRSLKAPLFSPPLLFWALYACVRACCARASLDVAEKPQPVARVGNGSNVHNGVGLEARHERKHRARVLQVGLDVGGGEGVGRGGRVVHAAGEVHADNVVPGGRKVPRGG